MDQQVLISVTLGCVATIAMVLVAFPGLFSESKAEQRQKTIQARPIRQSAHELRDPNARRKQVSDSLKDLENRTAAKSLTLETRIAQAGLEWTRQRYWIISGLLGLALGGAAMVINGSPLIAAASAASGAFGLPRWVLSYLRDKRFKQFRLAFPDALDMITRGVKAGLPLGDCLRMIAREAAEPVRSEFRHIIQAQGIGLGVGEATDRMAERIPIPETNFFTLVINIQQKSGGNLSEAMGNLSRVLRERKKMEGKIKAMSSEAKASAGIIGSLPIVVGGLVWVTSPQYISLLWTTDTGRMVMVGSACWMSLGIFIIKKMVSFDF
ncbi:type II secretion system F family protein [Lichenifustis flavocetrariae]|uniref:Type II secretion system F family protein n=1 Tax=Lichenifustis flavocetrariae TaxID=2949735 RepID=A0AA41YSH3_9HYPH|nr:type II secretion system F family protein [Lichenifustis flavocetrariae]MCW6506495.1 type II secretion system F family protein [Lichenifustis flavocetrariae]